MKSLKYSYKAKYPENTILAFHSAIEAGCQVIETDLHISSDKKIVIAHDIDTERVFGARYDITKTPYDGVLSELRTLREPHCKMPLFTETLKWFIEEREEGKEIKLMLDIKTDNDPDELFHLIKNDLESFKSIEYWYDKLIFGLWRPDFYKLEFLKNFDVVHIAFDVNFAKTFVKAIENENGKISAVSLFSMVIYTETEKNALIELCETKGLKIWFWTINVKPELDDALKACQLSDGSNLLTGIITDDPISVRGENSKSKNLGIVYNIQWWIRKRCYLLFLFLVRRNYNVFPLFKMLKRVGFI